MKFKNAPKYIAYTLVIAVLGSCGGNTKKENDTSAKEFEQAQDELKESVKLVLYQVPSPAEIPFLLQATGADFDPTLINSIDNVDGYASMTNKAILNLGIYATDVGYLSSYEKTQESLTYMRSCRKLADNVGLSDSFSAELIDQFEKSVESKDSLATLVNETIANAENMLKEDNRENLAAMLITGSFIEGIYLSTQIVERYPDNLPDDIKELILIPLIRMILDQKEPMANLIAMVKGTEQNDQTASILKSLESVYSSYEALNIEEKIRNQEANFSAETIREITSKISKLRNEITS